MFLQGLNKNHSENDAKHLQFSKRLICLVERKEGSSHSKYMECYLSFILCELSEFVMAPLRNSNRRSGPMKPWGVQVWCSKTFFFFSWLNLLWFSGKNSHSLLIPSHSFQPSLLVKIVISGSHSMYLLTPTFSRWFLLWVYVWFVTKKIMQDFEN